MELETINRLYLELSQVATAKTSRELKLEDEITKLRAYLQRGVNLLHHNQNKEVAEYRSRADLVLRDTL